MIKIYLIIIIVLIINILNSCRTAKPDIFGSNQENIQLSLFQNNIFKYEYYKLSGMNYEESNKVFCTGTYNKISRNTYELYPDDFDPNSVKVNINFAKSNDMNMVHVQINTNIYPDRTNEYQMIILNDSLKLHFTGITIDTIIASQVIKKFKVMIVLPNFYINGHPPALYDHVITEPINVDANEFIKINIPITLDYFYYKNNGVIKLQDQGKYFLNLTNHKKVKKYR